MQPVDAQTVRVTFDDGTTTACPAHAEVGALLPGPQAPGGLPYIGARINNEITSLTFPLEIDSSVRFLTMADPDGWQVYERSISFLLAKAVRELFPDRRFSLEYSFGPGLYCSLEDPRENATGALAPEDVARIGDRMRALVQQDIPIRRIKLPFTEALRQFESSGQVNKVSLLKFNNPPYIVMHQCGDFADIAHGPRAPRTGSLLYFDLIPYPPGFVLQLPAKGNPTVVAPFRDQPHLFQIFQEHKKWGRILGVNTVGRLNEVVASGEISNFIKIAESLHEKKVGQIADRISAQSAKVRVALIAGPSSSGKTTFAKRLAIQLRVNGLRPVSLSLDNYFFEHDRTPRDAAGNLDFEHIESIDIELFDRNLLDLLSGKEVELPTFNFTTKQREFRGDRLQIDRDQILIIEGIHGLNPRLTYMLPQERIFRTYVSALTQLSIDCANRISTTDNRLLRRLIRDYKFRRHSAVTTFGMWPSVRRGEEIWVFPFQGEAHATFNSALDYELAVLKPLAEPLLAQVKPSDPEYSEARRMTAFLTHFLEIPDREVPSTSILREYIGRSSFRY